jgi:hypothetical protein
MISDHLNIERVLSGVLPFEELSLEERDFCTKYRPIFAIGLMASQMAQSYYAHRAAITVARDPRANSLIAAEVRGGQAVPVGDVTRKDGTGHVYDIHHYLEYARTNATILNNLERVWIVGSLIAVGDALAQHDYLNRVPLLELVRHIRNGVAHGNRFDIRNPDG